MKESKLRTAGAAAGEVRREGGVMGAVDTVRSWPERIREFYKETRLEMKRVTWPERKQVQATTVVVIVAVFFFAFYLFLTDNLIDLMLRRFFRS